ncbi:hypothetical protein PTKU15_79670 [Paraburkholderia terrae]|nr:hypothetical protein PTKU15_79670 [Paraburkholderia terrae]
MKAKWSPGQPSIGPATCVPAQDYLEGSGSAGDVLGDGQPDITGYAFGVYEGAQTRHVTFGAGSFALNALGFSASANRQAHDVIHVEPVGHYARDRHLAG